MDSIQAALVSELHKIAAATKRRERGDYTRGLRAVIAAAPVAAAQSLTDLPRGAVDYYVDKSIQRTKRWGYAGEFETNKKSPKFGKWVVKSKPTVAQAFKGRGLGRAMGRFGPGLLTTPVFMSGIKDVMDAKDKKQRQRGYAKIVGSGLAFSTMKGTIEGIQEARVTKGVSFKKALGSKEVRKALRGIATTRGALGATSAAMLAGSIAKGLKSKKGKQPSAKQKYLMPALAGAAIGAGKGAAEGLNIQISKKGLRPGLRYARSKRGFRSILGPMGGRATAGVIGAVALSEIMGRALKPKKPKVKTAAEQRPPNLPPRPGELYDQTTTWARRQSPESVYSALNSARAGGRQEATPTRRAMYYALHDDLKRRGVQAPTLRMRERTHPKVTSVTGLKEVGLVAAVASSPHLYWKFGVDKLSRTDKDRVLSDAIDRMIAKEGIFNVEMPESKWRGSGGGEFRSTMAKVRIPHPYKPGEFLEKEVEQKIIGLRPGVRPAIRAHELGHATTGKALRKVLHSRGALYARTIGAGVAVGLPLVALDSFGDKSFATKEELESRARFVKRIGTVSAALMAPTLIDEGMASAKALKYLTEAGFAPGKVNPGEYGSIRKSMQASLLKGLKPSALDAAARGVKVLLPAFATYAAPLAVPLLASALLKRKARRAERGKR